MKIVTFDELAMIRTLIMIYLTGAHSMPLMQQKIRRNQEVTPREANSDPSTNFDSTSEAQFQTELVNLSIPSYLKDVYYNLTYPNGATRPSSKHEETNTIQSYKNQAKSKLGVLAISSLCKESCIRTIQQCFTSW